jgi:hypothetical protein
MTAARPSAAGGDLAACGTAKQVCDCEICNVVVRVAAHPHEPEPCKRTHLLVVFVHNRKGFHIVKYVFDQDAKGGHF